MKTKLKVAVHAVADGVISEEEPVTFEQGPIEPQTSIQILVRDTLASLPFHSEEAINKLVLEGDTVQHKGANNRLSSAQVSRSNE